MELKELIISKLAERKYGTQYVKRMRLVSKSWCAAVDQSPRRVMCHADRPKLGALCAIFPNMEHLTIAYASAYTQLDVLAALSRLTSIRLYSDRSNSASQPLRQPCVSVSSLPSTLRDLTCLRARIIAEHPDKTILPHLTRLSLQWEQTEHGLEAWDLVSQLPQIKV